MNAPAQSPARQLAEYFADYGAEGHELLDDVLRQMTVTELALLGYDWRGTWARPHQLIDISEWSRSLGFLTSRRWGKTRSIAEWINEQVYIGNARRIGFCAQSWEDGEDVIINGECGLVATAPPWNKAEWVADELKWPNGARGRLFTPERPQKFRGPGLDIFWASELQSWPAARMSDGTMKMMEAFSNAELMTSQGMARVVWDATPKRRHQLIRQLRARSEEHPLRHVIRCGRIEENADNLGADVIADLRRTMGKTKKAREELDGEYFDEDEDALWEQAWIDDHRRDLPPALDRRILSLDPAISDRAGTDDTGFIELGLGEDGQVYVIEDRSGTYVWERWGTKAVKLYNAHSMDCIVIERNRGGDACVANIRACAKDHDCTVELLKPGARTRHRRGTIYCKEIATRESKTLRAEPVATLYEQGRVSHVNGRDLNELEDLMTTWCADDKESPDALDALVHGVAELADLKAKAHDYRKQMQNLGAVADVLRNTDAARETRELLLGGGGRWRNRGLGGL